MTENTARHAFEVDKTIIYELVYSQSGPLDRAFMEMFMNASDAMDGGTERPIEVVINSYGFQVRDYGRGFQSVEEVHLRFGTFGVRHEEGERKHGRFSLGRAQMMVHAAMSWQSGLFQMDVDMKHHGFEYDLRERDASLEGSFIEGCFIEGSFYEQLSPSELQALIQHLQEKCRYVRIPIQVNGSDITSKQMRWDYEDEICAIALRETGGIRWFDRGFFVTHDNSVRSDDINGRGNMYVSAIVYTKQALMTNMARNEVMPHDPLLKQIRSTLRRLVADPTQRKEAFDERQKRSTIQSWLQRRGSTKDIQSLPLVTDVAGVHHKLEKFMFGQPRHFTVAPKGSDAGTTLHKQKQAWVLAEITLKRFGVTTVKDWLQLVEELLARDGQHASLWPQHTSVAFHSIQHLAGDENRLLLPKEIPTDMVLALRSINMVMPRVMQMLPYVQSTYAIGRNEVIVHVSASKHVKIEYMADVHTIAVSKGALQQLDTGFGGWLYIMTFICDVLLKADPSVRLATSKVHAERLGTLMGLEYTHTQKPQARSGWYFHELVYHAMRAYINLLQQNGQKILSRKNKVVAAEAELLHEHERLGIAFDIRPQFGVE